MEKFELASKGKDIEDILKAMDIPCALQEATQTQFSERYEFTLKNAKSFSLIPKAINVLKTAFHTSDIYLVDSKNDYKGVSKIPFALEIKRQNGEAIYDFSKEDLDRENQCLAFLGLDNSMKPVYLDIQSNTPFLIAGALCSDVPRLLNNMMDSLSIKNTKETLEIVVVDTRKALNIANYSQFLYEKRYYLTDEYECIDVLDDICCVIEDREEQIQKKKASAKNFSNILVILNDLSDILSVDNFIRKDIIVCLEELLRKGRQVKLFTILLTQMINSKSLPTQLKGLALTRLCFKTNTPSESTSILGSNKASKILANDEAIFKNIETSTESQIKVIELNEHKHIINTKIEPRKKEVSPNILIAYKNLNDIKSLTTILQNFFKKNGIVKYFELFASPSEKQDNHFIFSNRLLPENANESMRRLFELFSNTYSNLRNAKSIFDDYQKIKYGLSDINEVDIDEETYGTLKSLVNVYESLVGQKIIESDDDTQTAFYLLALEFYLKELENQFKLLSNKYNLFNENEVEIIQKLYNNDMGLREIKEFLALRKTFIDNPKNYSYDLLYQEIENFVETQIKDLKQKQMLENLINFKEDSDKIKIADIDLMSGPEFESFIADLFAKQGYEVEVTKSSGDQGVDVVAKKNDVVIAIQTKCYSGVVGNHAIMEAVGGMKFYNANKCMVITNSTFTKSAIELARANNVELWDRQTLKEKMDEV